MTSSYAATQQALGMPPDSVNMSLGQLRYQIELAQSYGHLSQTKLLAHCLRRSTSPFASTEAEDLLRDAVIVGVDAEWFEYDASRVNELGVSVLLPEDFSHADSPWHIISKMQNFHVRIQRNAHLVNSELCNGYPDKFQFGQTSFVTDPEAKNLLKYAFSRPEDKREIVWKPRPVIFIGHAVDNDIQVLKEHLGFDEKALDVVVATIDTQQMAREAGFVNPPLKMRLSHLMSKFGIVEPYLHNAGNDIVCTMIAAILMACAVPQGDHAKSYVELKQQIQTFGGRFMNPPGTPMFCTNCKSMSHFVQDCETHLLCDFCQEQAGGGIVLRSHHDSSCIDRAKWEAEKAREAANKESLLPTTPVESMPDPSAAHQVSTPPSFVSRAEPIHPIPTTPAVPKHLRISMPKYPFPCALCIVSPEPTRHKTQFAYSHLEKDCTYRPATR